MEFQIFTPFYWNFIWFFMEFQFFTPFCWNFICLGVLVPCRVSIQSKTSVLALEFFNFDFSNFCQVLTRKKTQVFAPNSSFGSVKFQFLLHFKGFHMIFYGFPIFHSILLEFHMIFYEIPIFSCFLLEFHMIFNGIRAQAPKQTQKKSNIYYIILYIYIL